MGVVSVDGMRLKARNDRPRLPGTYPPHPRPEAGEGRNSPRLSSWSRSIVAGSGEREYSRARLLTIWWPAGGIGGGYGIRADYEKIIRVNY